MNWIQKQIDNPAVFPATMDEPFPDTFRQYVSVIFRRLTRVYSHIYHHHFEKIVSLGAEAHLNTAFKHFYYFITEFELVDERELQPLESIVNAIVHKK
mmetsp:Transcript_6059/g.18473  ORF Transcript_6059/g.18473 Transcript_6059/m.18473 type:complete len:98 (+) Transcript_6059:371-664(+)